MDAKTALHPLAQRERERHDAWMQDIDFDRAPFTVAWEVTRACALVCLHCRAEAQPRRHPLELTTQEGFRLIDDLAEFGSPILVFTGGDPMMRRDLFDLIAYAAQKGLRPALTPSATRLVTRQRLLRAQEAGVRRVAMSLDGPTPEVHDHFRGFSGSFQRTMEILQDLREVGLPFQINTTVTRYNFRRIREMPELLERLGAVQWSLFFLVPTGRAQVRDMISPEEHEEMFHWLYDLSRSAPFDVKATEAPQYRRVVLQRERQRRAEVEGSEMVLAGAGFQYADGLQRPTKGVSDGRGFCFISHIGDVCPSGFLPLKAGNVRQQSIVEIYRDSPLFKALRDPERLKGKCGRCEFRKVCGGSRARAYALTGDYLASDPACVYEPPICK